MNTVYTHGKKLYRPLVAGPWTTLAEIKPEKAADIGHRWRGPKLSPQQQRQIVSFLRWSYQETKSEALAYVYADDLDEPTELQIVIPPQTGYSGLTVKPIDDADKIRASVAHLRPAPWTLIHTWHHHCSASAFQSAQDRADERNKDGLHVTLGKLDQAQAELHARTVFRTEQTDARLSDWLSLPDEIDRATPKHMHAEILAHLLCQPTDESFPDQWKARIERPAPVVYTAPKHQYVIPQGQLSQYHGGYGASYSRKLEYGLAELSRDYNVDYADIADYAQKLPDFAKDLLEVVSDSWAKLGDLISCCKELAKEQAAQQTTTTVTPTSNPDADVNLGDPCPECKAGRMIRDGDSGLLCNACQLWLSGDPLFSV